MGIRITAFLVLLSGTFGYGQTRSSLRERGPACHIHWTSPFTQQIDPQDTRRFLNFTGAQFNPSDAGLPRYYQEVALPPSTSKFTSSIFNSIWEPLSSDESGLISDRLPIPAQPAIQSMVSYLKKQGRGVISFIPLRRNPATGKVEKLVAFDLETTPLDIRAPAAPIHTYSAHSVLQTGRWYKMSITTDGIYKLSYSFLSSIGIDPSAIDPRNIRIYGNGGGMLPAGNSVPSPDDLQENAIYVAGESDGVFSASDYVLFYGKGPNTWSYVDTLCPKFRHTTNLYSDSAYYFITTDLGLGKRIPVLASAAGPTVNVSSFDDYAVHENDNVNFIKSGNQWFGEYFENINSYNFNFSFPNTDFSSPATIRTNLAAKFIGSGTADFTVSCQSGSGTIAVAAVAPSSTTVYSPVANINSTCFSFTPSSTTFVVDVTKLTTTAIAWLDYIEINVRRNLTMSGNQMLFRDAGSVGAGNISLFHLNSTQPVQVWDVTDPTNVAEQALTQVGSDYQFAVATDNLHQFIAFNNSTFLTPIGSGAVANQDLHGLGPKDFLIIAHPDFYDEALELASFHESHDSLTTVVVTPQQIYNEFSSGAQDVIGIRHFVKMFYDRALDSTQLPRYLLLFGDGSYDNKMRFGASNTNFIPTYQSDNSTVYTDSYVSDDYYGLLDDTEGLFSPTSGSTDASDIGIGRFPVKTKTEARAALNKIYSYVKTGVPADIGNSSCSNVSQSSPFGDWRNIVCFIGDDEDGGLHEGATGQGADQLAQFMDTAYNDYNIDKIYLDAYLQVSTPGGQRYPDVSDAIDKRMEKGCLVLNYTGHGGEVGLAHERIVEVPQINKWSNINNMPLFFTATCEFSRFDDPERTSAGEYVFLNPQGGAIALFTTTRLVYAAPNFVLNQYFYQSAFQPVNGRMPKLGDLYVYMKSRPFGYQLNGRNFTLLGDPAITLAYPKYDIATDSINNTLVTASSNDTLKALSLVTISGHVKDAAGNLLSTYNGILNPTVYDKAQSVTTLQNDPPAPGFPGSPLFTFKLQKNILYKGKVSVTNGLFHFSFVVPKDIAYQYGIGRISYYVQNGNEDGNGYYEKVIIGGSNDTASADNTGPEVNLFLNDSKFVFGGITDENPDLYAKLKDKNGVNTVGNGIGHDITAVLDANTDHSIVLNDYYQADLNSYKSGSIRYPFSDLSEGKHTLSLKVWDVYNNSSSTYTEFVVAKSAELALSHVLNYPNPFTTRTQFYFEQNRCCQSLDVDLQIFTISGKLVKSLSRVVQAEGYRSDPIEWDGRDDFGDRIGKGVYIYRLKVKTEDGSVAEKYEKLVILN